MYKMYCQAYRETQHMRHICQKQHKGGGWEQSHTEL